MTDIANGSLVKNRYKPAPNWVTYNALRSFSRNFWTSCADTAPAISST